MTSGSYRGGPGSPRQPPRRPIEFVKGAPLWAKIGVPVVAVLLIAGIAGAVGDSNKKAAGTPPTSSSVPSANTTEPSTTTQVSTTTETPTTVAPTTVGPTTTRVPATTAPRPAPTSRLVHLRIAPPSHGGSYDRDADFGGWIGQNGCQNTRTVLLIRESRAPVTFTSSSNCTVKTGRWIDPWSGVTTTVAHDFDIDHTVPLANAWVSGAWAWSHSQRVSFANDLADKDHLVPIALSENRSKGDSGPDAWKPPASSSWCRYALDWDHIKAKWHLSATPTEWTALVQMAATC